MNYEYFPSLFEANPFIDAELKFSDGSIKVSRMILAGHSKYFYDLFMKDATQTTFNIEKMKLSDFKMYYEYLHLGIDFIIDCKKIVSLLNVQIELNVPDIKIKLNEWISNSDFSIHQGVLLEKTNNAALKEYNDLSRKLISLNFEALCHNKTFDSFTRDNFLNLMNKDFIESKDQVVILDAITRWVEYDFNSRKADWLDLVSLINYDKIEAEVLNEYLTNNTNIFSIPQLIKFLYSKIAEKVIAKNVEKVNIKNVVPQSGDFKLILFGGSNAKQSVVEIDTIGNTVKEIGNLQKDKWRHCSEKIGNNVFVLGDDNSKAIEKYNLETNKSEIIHLQMSLNKYNYSSVVYSNKIYVIGGRGTRLIDTVEYFEPEKMTWINAPKLLTSVFCHDSVILDEIIYTIGDLNCNKFDPRDGKWSYLTDIPIQTHFSAVSSFGQTITCAGGGSNYYKNLCQVYDIRNNTWSKIADLPERAYAASSFENEVSLIVSGGESDFIQKYNKKDKTWSILNIHLLVSNAYSSKVVL